MYLRLITSMVMVITKSLIMKQDITKEFFDSLQREMESHRAEVERARMKIEKELAMMRQLPPQKVQKPKKEKKGIMFFLKQRMEMQAKLDTMALTLKNKEAEHDIAMKQREADFQQRVKDKDADFQLKLKAQQADFEMKEAKLKEEIERTKRTLAEEQKIAVDEVKSLTKLEAEQKIAKAQLDADKRIAAAENEKNVAISELKAKHAEDIAKVKQEEAQQNYKRMTEALADMNKNGSIQTKQQHEMVMALLNHARPGVTESRFLTGRIDGQPGSEPKTILTDGKTVNAAVV